MTETNIYKLEGLHTLSASYRLFEVRGNVEPGPDYYAGVTRLQRSLTRQYQQPFAVIERGEVLLLAVPEGIADQIVKHHNLVRWVAQLQPAGDTIEIDCSLDGDDLDPVRLRFLDFVVQTPLYKSNDLWRPRAGDAFYHREPAAVKEDVEIFEGVSARAAPYPGGGFGVILEAKTKLVSRRAIGAYANDNDIRQFKGSSCVYRMGDRWFEISVTGVGSTVSDPITFEENRPISLKEYLHNTAQRPVPASLTNLKGDGTVVTYRGSETAQVRAAPAELCFPVLDTHSKKGARLQRATIQPPQVRRAKAYQFKRKFLENLVIGNANITIANKSAQLQGAAFSLPDLLFGADHKLSGGPHANVRDYARNRRKLLENTQVGFYEKSTLDTQTLLLPQSVFNAWGPVFADDLIAEVGRLHPSGNYQPKIVTFDDLSAKVTSSSQANAILALARSGELPAGDCAIMVHTGRGKKRMQEKLPALLINKLRNDHDINAAVFHTKMADEAYRRQGSGTEAKYVRQRDDRGRFTGYLTGVALNKILIPNGKWPFVLAGELTADVVIGIDVKHNTAGVVLIAEGGRVIRHRLKTSSKHEKLSAGIVRELIEDLLRQEAPYLSKLTKTIVVHRDGRVFQSEIAGMNAACTALADEGLIDPDFDVNVLEIGKTSPAYLRFFGVENKQGQRPRIHNPSLGEWMSLSDIEGYVATTGWPLLLGQGTARPLKVTRASGNMQIEDALRDVFQLSCLAWTRPESSSRLPISLKLCDTFLKDEGAEHDEDDMLNGTIDTTVETA